MATPAGFENRAAFVWKSEPTRPAVLARMHELDLNSPAADALLKRAAGGLPFYNTCPMSMKTMLSSDGRRRRLSIWRVETS